MFHHGEDLRRIFEKRGISSKEQNKLLEDLEKNYKNADISITDKAMLDYVVKLTKNPEDISSADVELLKNNGFDDLAVHDICAITAYFAFVNRIADGLGVELEGE